MSDEDNRPVEPGITPENSQAATHNKAKNLDAATLKKFEGKTQDDIISMYVNLEKTLGKQAVEIGSLREKVKEIQDDPYDLFAGLEDTPTVPAEEDNPKEEIIMEPVNVPVTAVEVTAEQKAAQAALEFNTRLALARTDSSMPKFRDIEVDVLNLVVSNPYLSGDAGLKNAYNLVLAAQLVKEAEDKAALEVEAKAKAAELLSNATIVSGSAVAPAAVTTAPVIELSPKQIASEAWLNSNQGEEALTKLMMDTLTSIEKAKLNIKE